MLGEQIGESTGKRIVRRVLSTAPPTAEVSFEDSGNMLGVGFNGFGTYKSVIRPDGSAYGEGEGLMMTADGEMITWKGSGQGKFGPGGSIGYRGILYYGTPSQKLARLNGACGVFEYEVDLRAPQRPGFGSGSSAEKTCVNALYPSLCSFCSF